MPGIVSLQMVLALVAGPDIDMLDEAAVLSPIIVTGQRVANTRPASTYTSLATWLRYGPQVNLQSRGLPEGQADVTVRGGLFENTGFRLGAVTVFDPQTGHYSVDIPIDPTLLSTPSVTTDFENSLGGFNATVATVRYGFKPIGRGGRISAGLGSDSLRFATIRSSQSRRLDNGRQFGATVSAAASRGDGSLPYGDHDFRRINAHLQLNGSGSESNLLVGYHDKFFGWPGAYTGFASLPETDHTRLGLLLVDHRRSVEDGWWEVGAAYRWLDDDYDFDRRTVESGTPGSFEHATRSFSLGLAGAQHIAGLDWYFNGQFSADRLVRSTDLTHGNFNSRSYLTLSLAPGKTWPLGANGSVGLKGGLRLDYSNRDDSALMPMFSLTYEQQSGEGNRRIGLDFSRTSQLPGYTALNSSPSGLFGGNPDLGREYANALAFTVEHENSTWLARTAAWVRRDDGLVDWTYRQDAPFSRQANAVDIDVSGLEALLAWRSEALELIVGYAWIHKDADYGGTEVDASFYALNYAKHRMTLAVVYRPYRSVELRLDNEYRRQQENPLRTSGDEAWLASISVSWSPPFLPRTRVRLVADNLTSSDFQEFPGTPAMGRQLSLGFDLNW